MTPVFLAPHHEPVSMVERGAADLLRDLRGRFLVSCGFMLDTCGHFLTVFGFLMDRLDCFCEFLSGTGLILVAKGQEYFVP